MKQFEIGKSYKVNSVRPMTVTIEKRTAHYVTVSGDARGRFYAYRDNFFGLGEEIMIPVGKQKCFCFAGKEIQA